MQLLLNLAASLLATASVTYAFPSSGHTLASTITPVYQFPDNGSWIENLAVRPNGLILATRLDKPALYSIDPEAHTAKLVHTFVAPSITSLSGITRVKKDVYAINVIDKAASFAGNRSTGYVFTADFTQAPPAFKRAATIKEAGLLNGIAPVSEDVVLISDSQNGVLYNVNLVTGSYSVAASDVLLTPAANGTFPSGGLGVNGLKVFHDFAYFTSTSRGIFGRIPLSSAGKASGPVETIATVVTTAPLSLDDFVISSEGVAYSSTDPNDSVVAIYQNGAFAVIAGKNNTLTLAGCTSLAFVPGSKQREAYVATSGGQAAPINGVTIEPAKVVRISLPVGYHW